MVEDSLSFEDVCTLFEIASKDGALSDTKLFALYEWYIKRNEEEQRVLEKKYYFTSVRMLRLIKHSRR